MAISGDTCPGCGSPIPQQAIYCPHCGHVRKTATTTDGVGTTFLMVVLGVVVGLPAWFGLTLLGSALLSNVGSAHSSYQEFYVSRGATAFYIFLTFLTIVGLVLQARARLSPATRAFVIAFCCVMLGMFALCDLFSVASQT